MIAMDRLLQIRRMEETDIQAVLDIQASCYTELTPESASSLLAKLAASPATCFVASVEQRPIAYLISIPWVRTSPPLLNAPTCLLPSHPDCLYLHDLAVQPASRGSRAGQMLIAAFLQQLAALCLPCAALVAVQGSGGYWQRYGFRAVEVSEELSAKLSSYGTNVQYMTCVAPGV